MAASIISSPSGIISAIDNVTYVGNLSDLGTSPEERRFGYKLKNITDAVDITQYRYIRPHSAILEFPLSFEDDLRGLVQTRVPPLGQTVIVTDTSIWKTIALEYTERVINTDDCSIVDNLIGTTANVIVLNAHPQLYDSALPSAQPIVLHRIPKIVKDCSDTERFLWVFGATSITMTYRRTGQSLPLGSVTEDTNADEVSIVPIGFNRTLIPAGTNIIDVSFGSSPPHQSFRIVLDGCCCNENDCAKNIYFQTRWGGYEVIAMSCLSARQSLAEHQEWSKHIDPLATAAEKKISGALQINNKTPSSNLIFQKDFDYDCIDSRYLDDIMHSNNYFIKDYDENGVAFLARFILTSGQHTTYSRQDQITLTLSGKYSNRIKMPY